MTLTIIDSGVANLGSVQAALRRIGVPARVATDVDSIRRADALLLPGVGAFARAMAVLNEHGLVDPIRAAAADGVPVIGICLGMQLLAEESEEFGRHEGLGLIPGRVVRLEPRQSGERVPNIGWCDVTPAPDALLYREVEPGTAFYFVHSYVLECSHAVRCGGVDPLRRPGGNGGRAARQYPRRPVPSREKPGCRAFGARRVLGLRARVLRPCLIAFASRFSRWRCGRA